MIVIWAICLVLSLALPWALGEDPGFFRGNLAGTTTMLIVYLSMQRRR